VSRRKSWQEDLIPVAVAVLAQVAMLRFVDWANANLATQPIARQWYDHRFYFAPQLLGILILLLLLRAFRSFLREQGVRVRDFLRSAVVVLLLAILVVVAVHLDQLVALLGRFVPAAADAARYLRRAPVYELLSRYSLARLGVDLVAVGLFLLMLRASRPKSPDLVAAREAFRAGDFARAGELYLKLGNVDEAKRAFRKAKLPARVAALELRQGNARAAAELWEEAGDAWAWEAARAWEAAGEPARFEAARGRALVEARQSARWDRLAEVAESAGDRAGLADATRRIAEGAKPGGRNALWKRAAEAARAAGRTLEAAEAFRFAGEPLEAGPLFLEAGRPQDAARELERGGNLAGAAEAWSLAGQPKTAAELRARDLEGQADWSGAADAWEEAGNWEKAALMFERAIRPADAARAFDRAGRHERAAALFQKAGLLAEAAAAFEAAAKPEAAAAIYKDLRDWERSITLYRASGRFAEAASSSRTRGASRRRPRSSFARAGTSTRRAARSGTARERRPGTS